METIEVNVNANGIADLTIREAEGLNSKPIPEISIRGIQNSVILFINKLSHLISGNDSFIEVTRSRGIIDLTINPFGDQLSKKGMVMSEIKESEEFKLLQLNRKFWLSKELGDMLRMNKHLLAGTNSDVNGMIASLRQFEVEFNRKMKSSDDNRGNTELNKSQVITKCNIPKTIDFRLPLFKKDEIISLTADVEIDPENLKCILIVTGLTLLVEERMEFLLNAELNEIREHVVGGSLPIIYLD